MVPAVSLQPELQPVIDSCRPFRMFPHDFDGIQILIYASVSASYWIAH
jgi:hypothetical protein